MARIHVPANEETGKDPTRYTPDQLTRFLASLSAIGEHDSRWVGVCDSGAKGPIHWDDDVGINQLHSVRVRPFNPTQWDGPVGLD